jgi:hypothetical protein
MVQLLNSMMQQQQIEWHRAKVLELTSQSYSQIEIAINLQVDKSIVRRDMTYLKQKAHENLETHLQDKLPEEYQNCMTGMKRNLKQTLEIAETTPDPRTKLQARAIANDCYKYIMDLTTNGVVITDVIKFVQTNKEKLAMSTKEDNGSKESKEPDYDEDKDQLEEKQEETDLNKTKGINQVF